MTAIFVQVFPKFSAAFKEANPEMELLHTPMCLTLKWYKSTAEDESDEDEVLNEEEEDEDDKEMELDDDEEEPLGLVWIHEMQVPIFLNVLIEILS